MTARQFIKLLLNFAMLMKAQKIVKNINSSYEINAMERQQRHKELLMDNRLRRIENRLKKIELLFLKNLANEKKIKKEVFSIEKEEKAIESEQKKLEMEETQILTQMKKMEKEEMWHAELQYNCKFKIMDQQNVIKCDKTGKQCELSICPLWKK
jgi:cell division protein FtsB